MKQICIISTVHNTFDTRIFHKQAKSLSKKGYKVTYISPHEKNVVIDNINIVSIPKFTNRFFRFFFGLLVALKKSLLIKADVYHIHDPELLLIIPFLYIFKKKPIVFDVHEDYPASILSKNWIPSFLRRIISNTYKIIENILLKFVSGVIYTTPIVGERYINKKNITARVDNFPKIKLLENNNNIQLDYNKIIYVGGITEIRGAVQLVNSMKKVIDENENAYLELIGNISSDLKKKLNNIIDNNDLSNNINIKEYMPYEKLKEELNEAAIGIVNYLPYPNHLSCLPNKLFEYMATNTAVIASDFPLYREVVEDTNCGYLVDPENIDEIGDKILKLIDNKNLINELSKNGFKGVKEKYNWNEEEKKLYKLYEEII